MDITDKSKEPRRSYLSLGQATSFAAADKMLHVAAHFLLAVTLFPWQSGGPVQAETSQKPFGSSLVLGGGPPSPSVEERPAADLAAKVLILDELRSLENDVTETKKKRSFPGFGSPLDRLSTGSVDLKAKQRKVVEVPKRRFGIPLDRIGMNRLSNSRG